MKTKSFILLAVCYFIAAYHVKAQTYIPFVKEGKMWTEYWEADMPTSHGIEINKMDGDTFINNKVLLLMRLKFNY